MNLEDLAKPMPFKWRVQSANQYGCNCVAYIDARDVMDRLDEVCGPENWQDAYKEVCGNVYAGIGIRITNIPNEKGEMIPADFGWVWKWDCGTESNMEKEKGQASDAFKRAAVKWKIGRFLYRLEIIKVKAREWNGRWYPDIPKGIDLTQYCNNTLKAQEKEREDERL